MVCLGGMCEGGVCLGATVLPVWFMKHSFGAAPLYIDPAQLLGVGTSKGKLHVFDLGRGEVCAVAQFTAHKTHDGAQDPLFGQLGKQ